MGLTQWPTWLRELNPTVKWWSFPNRVVYTVRRQYIDKYEIGNVIIEDAMFWQDNLFFYPDQTKTGELFPHTGSSYPTLDCSMFKNNSVAFWVIKYFPPWTLLSHRQHVAYPSLTFRYFYGIIFRRHSQLTFAIPWTRNQIVLILFDIHKEAVALRLHHPQNGCLVRKTPEKILLEILVILTPSSLGSIETFMSWYYSPLAPSLYIFIIISFIKRRLWIAVQACIGWTMVKTGHEISGWRSSKRIFRWRCTVFIYNVPA